MPVAILDQAQRRCWRLALSLFLLFADPSGVMGTGWRERPWSAVVARRARCSKFGFCYYNGAVACEVAAGNVDNVSDSRTECTHNISDCSSPGDGRLLVQAASNVCNENVSKAEVMSDERKLKLSGIPRLSLWADADDDDEAWFEHIAEHGYFSGNSRRPSDVEDGAQRNNSAEQGYVSGNCSRPLEVEDGAQHSNIAEHGYFSGHLSRPLVVEDGAQHNSIAEQGYLSGNASRPQEVKNGAQHNTPDTCDNKILGSPQHFKEFSPASLVLQQNF